MATAEGEVDLATRLARTKDHSIRNIKAHLKTQEKRKLCKRRIRQFALPMDAIVRAVETKIQGRRRAKPVPKWLNRRRLRLDTDHAISTYEIFRSVDRTQPWNARRKHAEQSIALLDKFASFAFGREPRTGRLLRKRSGVAKYLDARYPKHEREKLFGQLRSAIRKRKSRPNRLRDQGIGRSPPRLNRRYNGLLANVSHRFSNAGFDKGQPTSLTAPTSVSYWQSSITRTSTTINRQFQPRQSSPTEKGPYETQKR